jgi:UDP-N-acetylmuramate--alanine ligase
MPDPVLASRYRALALAGLKRPRCLWRDLPAKVLVVDVARQRVGLLEGGVLRAEQPVSTALAGLGGEEGSWRTPPGWHRIHARIGAGAAPGTVFRSREATGEMWAGENLDEDLILTRILTLDGLEDGANRGPGCDSLARYIYLHGTNQEARLGTPISHGCVRLSSAGIAELFDLMEEGDAVLISEGDTGEALGLGRLHFVGVGGSGMSALAQFIAMKGGRASGSDRSFDRGLNGLARAHLEKLGIQIHPQDGSGVSGDCSGVVLSTAVEAQIPDFAEARRLGVPVLHRSELLAHLVAEHRTVAVTGTSGKSTTTAMIFEILRGVGRDPSLITGGELVSLQGKGFQGNAWAGASDLLVIEADESDGSVVRYHPAVGVILNLQRDHKEPEVVAEMFQAFQNNVKETLVIGEDGDLSRFEAGSQVFGWGPGCALPGRDLEVGAEGSSFRIGDIPFHLPVPGRHNAENALAAIAACRAVGVDLQDMVNPLSGFQGVARRFQILGQRRGVTVVDDFGHNPAKVAASIRTAKLRAGRILAIFQPHGYGPTRFLWNDFVKAFATELGPEDRLWMLEVFYAGGTATRDFSAAELAADIAVQGAQARFAPSREILMESLAAEAQAGDLVLVMGARDPSLTSLAEAILARLGRGSH